MLSTGSAAQLDRLAPVRSSTSAAATAMGRLDQALGAHPLAQAWLYRMRLDAARRQAAVDGELIDPWHLAATLEGLRLRMYPYLRMSDRLDILDKAMLALSYHQWMVEPDFDQEGDIQRAEAILAAQPLSLPPLLGAAMGVRAWIESGGGRPAIRAATIRFWRKRRVLRHDLPLTGAAAFSADRSWDWESWVPAFLDALQREAEDGLDLLYALERAWFDARRSASGRRRSSHLVRAIDLLAAKQLVSAMTLAKILRVAPKNALRMLDDLVSCSRYFSVSFLATTFGPRSREAPVVGDSLFKLLLRLRQHLRHHAPGLAGSRVVLVVMGLDE